MSLTVQSSSSVFQTTQQAIKSSPTDPKEKPEVKQSNNDQLKLSEQSLTKKILNIAGQSALGALQGIGAGVVLDRIVSPSLGINSRLVLAGAIVGAVARPLIKSSDIDLKADDSTFWGKATNTALQTLDLSTIVLGAGTLAFNGSLRLGEPGLKNKVIDKAFREAIRNSPAEEYVRYGPIQAAVEKTALAKAAAIADGMIAAPMVLGYGAMGVAEPIAKVSLGAVGLTGGIHLLSHLTSED